MPPPASTQPPHASKSPGRSVLLLVNRRKPDVVAALDEVRSLIASGGGKVVHELDADGQPISQTDADGADLIVVLGGDGTLMAQSRRCVALGLPMLGVNLGKLGFMAEFDLPALRTQAGSLFGGQPLLVQDRPMLRVFVSQPPAPRPTAAVSERSEDGSGVSLSNTLALNDAVVTAGPPYRMISIRIRIDGQDGPTVTGDGLIVSTAIGSTAYNASAGGPIISPDVPALAMTAIAPHTLSFRPVVVNLSSTIELEIVEANDGEVLAGDTAQQAAARGTALVLDGQVPTPLRTGDRITIRTHARPAKFVKNLAGSYWNTLLTKMRWAAPPAVRAR